ncbi:DUF6660 family protein [Olivibacter sp. CPCC 100613]|uniref:DUF6660 family protein n=1 Tax=Olivibacter sp. CPCC 100613 TaxID=3079931 RepID=UPI003FA5FFEB
MRLLSLICILIIVIQNAFPCRDNNAGISAIQKVTASFYSTLNHKSTYDESCSPFCQCGCCGTSTLQNQLIRYEVFIPETMKDYIDYIHINLPLFPHDIWQPPRA